LARRPETELSDDYALADPGAGPEEQAISLAQAQSIGIAIAGLPDKQRDVFELVHYQGLPYAEVSEALEIPVGTVKSRMFHALRQLSTQLNTLG
jgi:RNA polymerase sigma factor (sigma-70 family)